jgi:hypothetical protein
MVTVAVNQCAEDEGKQPLLKAMQLFNERQNP